MDKLTDTERRALLEVARSVHAYKLLQAKGYERLAGKGQDARTQRLLAEISRSEVQDAEYWAEKITDLSGQGLAGSSLLELRIRVMMSILGTRGFFEWAIIAEDDSVQDLAVLAENLGDADSAQAWTRIAADERLHIERIKREILGMEGWEMGGGGGVRDVIFGANEAWSRYWR